MKIVIAVASGNIGYRVAGQLINAGEMPVLLARNAAKVAGLLARGAVLVEGGSDDAASVMKATQNADALLWLTPPAFGATKAHLVHLRPGYFMQNFAAYYASMQDEGLIRMSFAPDHDIPGSAPMISATWRHIICSIRDGRGNRPAI